MATSSRRVGAETSKTRDALLNSVEKLMLEEGYAAVSYRALAAKAGVTASLVQYYFPSLDDIFVAAIRRYSERNLRHLTEALERRADDPLRAVWECSWEEATGALMTEFMALGNHRKSIRNEIAAVTESVRKVQLDALVAKFGENARPIGDLSLPALQLLMSGLPKLLNLEAGVGVQSAHTEVTEAFERYIDAVEPRPKTPKTKPAARRQSPARKASPHRGRSRPVGQ
jgi:AcrR family transcriptional regulator